MTTSNPKTILVTGASGFIATHVCKCFLEHGYHVRGTVRSKGSEDRIREVNTQYKDQLSFVLIKDIAQPGALDEAVKGVDGIIHTASPFKLHVEDNERDLLLPAVRGTLGVLHSAKAYAPKVRRIVLTSSYVAAIDPSKGFRPGYTYTEADWCPLTYDEAKRTTDGSTAYTASKALAERVAWKFIQEERPDFTLSTICPSMVYGPVAQFVSSMSSLNTSSDAIYSLMNGCTTEVPPTLFPAFVDVRDVANAHLKAFESPRSANQRFMIVSGSYCNQVVCDVLREIFPSMWDKIPIGKPGEGCPSTYSVSNEKARTVLGMTFRSLEECVKDTADSLLALKKNLGE